MNTPKDTMQDARIRERGGAMSEPKRYRPAYAYHNPYSDEHAPGMEEDGDGDYVSYDDYAALRSQLTTADRIRELEAQQAASEPVAWALYEGDTMLHATTKQTTRASWQKDVDRGPRTVPLRIVPLYAHPTTPTRGSDE